MLANKFHSEVILTTNMIGFCIIVAGYIMSSSIYGHHISSLRSLISLGACQKKSRHVWAESVGYERQLLTTPSYCKLSWVLSSFHKFCSCMVHVYLQNSIQTRRYETFDGNSYCTLQSCEIFNVFWLQCCKTAK